MFSYVLGKIASPMDIPRSTSRIKVVCRKRPLSKKEASGRHQDVVGVSDSTVTVCEPKTKVDLTRYTEKHVFCFDDAFDEYATNQDVYDRAVKPLVHGLFQGLRGTCFAYGQTGSGKTFTTLGPAERSAAGAPNHPALEDPSHPDAGIFLKATADIFASMNSFSTSLTTTPTTLTTTFGQGKVMISFYEIYCGKLYDLLNNRSILAARENGKREVVIVGLREVPVTSVQDMMNVVYDGLAARTTGQTAMNMDSSRSHAVLQIALGTGGKLSFIDLAGSERGADTMDQDRQTRIDGAEINKSLLALKECIRAMDMQLDHTPFRGSKLTQVLKDSFVSNSGSSSSSGGSGVVMIANLSPSSACVEHTLNTLRYAYRVKELPRPGAAGVGGAVMTGRALNGGRAQNAALPVLVEEDEELSSSLVQGGGSRENSSPEGNRYPGKGVAAGRGAGGAGGRGVTQAHEELIGRILNEEELLVAEHRRQVDKHVELLQREMAELDVIDRPGSDVEHYVGFLEEVLKVKAEMVDRMKAKVNSFKGLLREEARLSAGNRR